MLTRLILFVALSIVFTWLVEMIPQQIPFDGSKDLVALFPFLENYYLKLHYFIYPVLGLAYGNICWAIVVTNGKAKKAKQEMKEPVFDLDATHPKKVPGKGLRVVKDKPEDTKTVKIPPLDSTSEG